MSTQIKEHPIIFSGSMIRAILDGSKSQTRRVISPQPVDEDECGPYIQVPEVTDWGCGETLTFMGRKHIKCPYGVPGDMLWVRETFVIEDTGDYGPPNPLPEDRPVRIEGDDIEGEIYLIPHYRATEPEPHIVPWDRIDGCDDTTRWHPSIHMPRWASRISLTVKDVRVERVQDISEEDARDEGVEFAPAGPGNCTNYVIGFADLWDSINARRGYGWDVNPWVWRVEF